MKMKNQNLYKIMGFGANLNSRSILDSNFLFKFMKPISILVLGFGFEFWVLGFGVFFFFFFLKI